MSHRISLQTKAVAHMASPQASARGFTLVEMLATLSVLVILTSLAATSMSPTLNKNRTYATQDEFVAYLALARSEAVRRGVPVVVAATAPTTGNAFGGGWTVFADTNGNGSYDTGEPVLRSHEALPPTILIGDGTTTTIAFNSLGFLTAVGAADIKLCPSDPTLGGYEIVVQPNGLTDVKEFSGNPNATGTRSSC